ncbi:MAG: sulfatase-like hydrolase/transferase [Pseudomonadota bacterium]
MRNWLLAIALTTSACSVAPEQSKSVAAQVVNAAPPNILIMIADDLGVETLSCYGIGQDTAITPNLDKLCSDSIRFTSAWSQPICTPTRTGILTGRHGFRTGSQAPGGPIVRLENIDGTPKTISAGSIIGHLVKSGAYTPPDDAPMLMRQRGERIEIKFGTGPRLDELTLAQILKSQLGYETAAIGKWHMSDETNGGVKHPNLAGFDLYQGPMYGGVENYYSFKKWRNGEPLERATTYATTDTVNDAISWIEQRESDAPWFMWLAFNAPHDPFHKPPNELISERSQALDPDGITPANAADYYKAMIEALDHEIGRLLSELPEETAENTVIVFLGDNGSPMGLVGAPYTDVVQSKATTFQAGLHIPLLIDAPGYAPGTRDMLVHTSDLFSTILSLTGLDAADLEIDKILDSRTLQPIMSDASTAFPQFNYADLRGVTPIGQPNERVVRNARYKLYRDERTGSELLYDLERDPTELSPINPADADQEQVIAIAELRAELEALLAR